MDCEIESFKVNWRGTGSEQYPPNRRNMSGDNPVYSVKELQFAMMALFFPE